MFTSRLDTGSNLAELIILREFRHSRFGLGRGFGNEFGVSVLPRKVDLLIGEPLFSSMIGSQCGLQLTLERSQTPLQDLVLETVDGFAASARQKGLNLSADVEEEMERVTIDGLRIRRVLVNLLQNAIRHTPPDGSVTVVARDKGDEVRVDVTDTGTGIEADDLPKIWSRFFRADESRTREADGLPSSGLGLAIARGIIDLHGGWIEASSEKGSGSRFSFGLPKTTAAAI